MNKIEKPYILKRKMVVERVYNKNFGDNKICDCGHAYIRHFDSYENNRDVGCKYCACYTWREMQDIDKKTTTT